VEAHNWSHTLLLSNLQALSDAFVQTSICVDGMYFPIRAPWRVAPACNPAAAREVARVEEELSRDSHRVVDLVELGPVPGRRSEMWDAFCGDAATLRTLLAAPEDDVDIVILDP
jgi:hypothetical protein